MSTRDGLSAVTTAMVGSEVLRRLLEFKDRFFREGSLFEVVLRPETTEEPRDKEEEEGSTEA